MTEGFILPARAQLTAWVNGRSVDVDEPVLFDAHNAAAGLTPEQFSRAAAQILDGKTEGFDELALASSRTQMWFQSDWSHGFTLSVDRKHFVMWLERYGLSEDEARNLDEASRNRLTEALDQEGNELARGMSM